MSRRWIVGLGAATALSAFLVACPSVFAQQRGMAQTQGAVLPGGIESWQANGAGGRYVAPVVVGKTPKVRTLGVVLTDTDCAADAEGLSHCHNQIELSNGARITIRDNHNMMVNPCLSPGESVSVGPLGAGWVVVQKQTGE